MKYYFVALALFLVIPNSAFASLPTITEVDKPYDVVPLEDGFEEPEVFLGELDNFPIMYELATESTTTLSVVLHQRYVGKDPVDFALIAIRMNDRGGGVTEVARLRPTAENWERVKDSGLGMAFSRSDTMVSEIGPGVYRVEVSTPDNIGRYMVTFGPEAESIGYFATIDKALFIQDFFGHSFLRILASSHVYYPLGILLILFGIHRTWKLRKNISHVD